jgi:hypothetical protein
MRTARAFLLTEAAAGTTLSPLLRAADGPVHRADAHVPVRSFLDDVRRKTALRKVMGPKDENPFTRGDEQEDPEAAGADDFASEPESQQKEDVNYRYAGDPAHSCGACRHYQEPGSCEIVSGLIRPVDVCDKFTPDGGGAHFGRAVVAEAFGQRDDSWGRSDRDDGDSPTVYAHLEPLLGEWPDTTPAGVNPWLQDQPEESLAEEWSDAARAAALAARQAKSGGGASPFARAKQPYDAPGTLRWPKDPKAAQAHFRKPPAPRLQWTGMPAGDLMISRIQRLPADQRRGAAIALRKSSERPVRTVVSEVRATLDSEAGTSAGAVKGWQSRKGGGGSAAPAKRTSGPKRKPFVPTSQMDIRQQDARNRWAAGQRAQQQRRDQGALRGRTPKRMFGAEAAPPGMEPVVKALKRKPGVDNPWAVAWSQYHKGTEAHRMRTVTAEVDD